MASPYFGSAPPNLFGTSGQAAAKAATRTIKVRAHTRTIKTKEKPVSPAPSAVKPPAAAPVTQSVVPGQASSVKRSKPNFPGEPVAGYVSTRPLVSKSKPIGAPAKPVTFGAANPLAHLGLRPYYTNTNTMARGAGPAGQESTQWNAAQAAAAHKMQVENYGKPGYIARSLIPGGLNQSDNSLPGAVARAANAASLVLPGGGVGEAAGLFGLGVKAIRDLRGVKDVAEVAPPAAHAAESGIPVVTQVPEHVAAVRGSLPGAKAARVEQETGYSVERGKRFAAARQARQEAQAQGLPPTEQVRLAKQQLAGELPKINYKGFSELNDESLQAMVRDVLSHPTLQEGQKYKASDALVSALSGRTPTHGELALLEHVFGPETATSLAEIAKSPFRDKLLSTLNIPRSLMASFDLSAPFRQGLMVATRHPVIFAKNFGPMVKSFGSEKVYQATLDEIHARPTYPLMLEGKVPFTELGSVVGQREERFGSDVAEKLTGGKYGPVRASGRAFTAYLDKTRADVFDHLLQRAQAQGVDFHDAHFLRSLGRYIGSATGRGDLGHFNDAAKYLNAVFFSPRLMASRLNFLNPVYYARLHPFARKEALRSALQLAGTASTLLALASQIPGVKVETDPRNPDWGKLRFGNTRLDIGGGFQQELRLIAQLATGVAISSTTGKSLSLTSGGFGKPTRLDIIQRFFMGKESPIASLVTDWLRGSTQIGQKFSWDQAAAQRMIPLLGQDAYDLYKEKHGGMNGLMAALAGYGVGSVGIGLQTYGPPAPKRRSGGSGGSGDYFGGGSSSGGSPYFSSSSSSGGGGYFGGG